MKVINKIYQKVLISAKYISFSKTILLISLLMLWDKVSQKKIIILDLEEFGFIQYILPIVRNLQKKDGSISYYIATNYIDSYDKFSELGVPDNKIFHNDITPALFLTDVFLSPHTYGQGPRRSIRINVSHNLPVKREWWPIGGVLNYNIHFLTGPMQRKKYENMFRKNRIDTKKIQILNIGFPKSDALLQGRYEKGDVLRGLGLNPEKSTLLYAPSWDPGASLRSFGEEVIENLLTIRKVNVIVKLHPVSYTPETSPNFEFYTGGIKWVDRLSRFEQNPNFRHVPEYSIDPLLLASDVMITDISSVALEFIILDRPVIYLDCPEYFEKTLKMPGWDTDSEYACNDPKANAGRHVGLVVEELSELRATVQRSLDVPHEFSERRKRLSKQLLYNPGKGSEAAANAIMELLDVRN